MMSISCQCGSGYILEMSELGWLSKKWVIGLRGRRHNEDGIILQRYVVGEMTEGILQISMFMLYRNR